jgi:hypothetical protein
MNRKLILKYHWLTSFNNLYNFILIILNNFLKKILKIPTDGFTEGIYPSIFYKELKNIYWKYHNHRRRHRRIYSIVILWRVEKYLLDMPLSPTE